MPSHSNLASFVQFYWTKSHLYKKSLILGKKQHFKFIWAVTTLCAITTIRLMRKLRQRQATLREGVRFGRCSEPYSLLGELPPAKSSMLSAVTICRCEQNSFWLMLILIIQYSENPSIFNTLKVKYNSQIVKIFFNNSDFQVCQVRYYIVPCLLCELRMSHPERGHG